MTEDLPLDWRLDGTAVDMSNYVDTSTTLWSGGTNYVTGRVTQETRNMDVDVSVMFPGVGKAWKEFEDGRHCTVNQQDCYTARIHPTIKYVSSTRGFTTGGTILRLIGTSLDAKDSLEILVDGAPCKLIANNKKYIWCETSETTLKPPQDIYAGQHGLLRSMYNNTDPRPYAGNLDEVKDQAKYGIITSFEIP